MSGDKFDQLYNALKADGAVSGSRANFRNFVYASGKHGYLNRKKLYDALHADGAVSSKSYEEFAQRLGLHATNPQPRVATSQPQQQASRPQTAAQMAISQGYRKQQHQQPVDYLHRPQSQRGKAPVGAPKNASPFVQSLYEVDNAKNGADYPVNYSSPKGVQQVYEQNQRVRKQAAKSAADHIASDEYRRQSQPMIDNGTVGVMKPMGEIEQEMSDSASKFVDANLGDYINNAVLSEQNAAAQRGLDAANNVPLSAGAGGMGLMVKGMAYNKEVDPDLMAKHLTDNARNGFLKMFQDPNFVAKVENEATRLGVTPEAYMESIIPHLKDRLATSLQQSEYQKALPKNMLDNIANRFIDSNTIGKALRLATQTRGQRILSEQASAATAEGKNPYYKGGTVENVAADVAGMVADPIFGASAKLGGAVSGKLIGNSTKIGALMANGNLAQRLGLSGVQAVTSGGVTGFTFGATSGAIQNFSTGEDTSLGGTLKAMLASGASEAGSFATMSLAGVPLGQFGRSIGLKSVKTTPLTKDWFKYGSAKIGMEAAKTYMEGMGMYLGGYVSGKIEGRNQEFSLFDGTLESLPTAIGFRLTHLAEGLKGKRYDKNGKPLNWWNSTMVKFNEFLTSDKAKVSQYMMTEGEKQQIMNSIDETNAANPGLFGNVFDAAMKAKTELKTTGGILEKPFIGEPTSFGDVERDMKVVETVYDKIIADPNVSWDAKAKFSAMVMGVMPSSRPLMDYVLFTNEVVMKDNLNRGTRKYINEYSKYGELLSKREYTDADEKDKALYTMKAYKEQARLWNAISAVTNIDKNNYDMQNDFYMQGIKNAVSNADIRAFVDGLGTKGSAVEREFTNYAMEKGNVLKIFDSVAKQYGMETADLVKAFNKSAMRRTDREQEACIHLRQIMEFTAFPPNKVHAEQSNLNGKDVASDNNLGTELPNGEAVKQELNGLRQAEAEMDVLMRDNDVFGQHFEELKKQGLTNPQIYQWMIENGLTQEELEPFAHYINANARVLGMQEATKQKIEEVVSGVVQDWSYKGELNGQKMNGEQVVYVQDSDGRVLIVGSGDVAFDPTTGRAKEDVGDLLICFDPNTKEMVYLKTDDVTFMQTQKPEDFANEYRQRLQMINSQPYNEAAQEQAMQDAGKSENQNQSESIGINQNQNSESNGSEKAPQVDTTSPEASTITAKNNTTKEGLAPQEQPQQTRKFADGTDVPMTKDSKGRPTPDYGAMKPEQAAEILSQDFGENAEKVVDGQIKKAEKALKDAEKMKVDYTAEPNDILEQEQVKAQTVEAAKKQLEQAQNIKKAMTAKAVAETVGKPTDEKVEGANEASSEVAKKFQNAPRLQGNHVSKRLPNGDKISGHYEIVPAESLTPSHDAMNDYKKSEGFPVDAEGRTINDRDYEHDKAAQQTTDQMAQKYSGQAITQVPTVSDEGIVYDGNGRTMAGQKAAKNGTDAEYIEDLMDNAQNYGFTKEQIEQSGIEHPRLVMVTDERLPYDTATFSMFNRNEKKTQSNTEQAVAKAKTLTSEEVGAIVADIEGNGSLDAFFNNSKAINDLVKTLVSKGVIGQNEVAGFMDGPDRLSAQGKEYVKNLLLGSVFKPETIRMLGVDSKIKNAAINGIRAIMDNLKLGDYSLRDELDQAVQLLYEARRSKMSVEDLLKQSSAFEENARDRFPMIAQAMAQALEDKPTTFRELMSEYNNIAKNYNTNEGTLGFYDKLTPEQVVEEFLNASKAIKNNNIKLYGKESETERSNDASGNEEPAKEAGGAAGTEGNGNAETEPEIKVKKALKRIATEITKQTGIEVVTDEKVGQSTLEDAEATDSNVKYSRVTDKDLIAQLEKEPKIKVYRAMQVIDGKLYPPMAAYADGKLVEANELGKWIQSDEMPDSKNTVYKIKGSPTTISKDRAVKGEDGVWRDSKTGKELVTGDDGEPTWYFKLQKGKGADGKKLTDVPAAYNPYWHLSYSPLNDQFKSAWIRPNIVVVECEVPASELNSGYRAEHAKNSVGMTPWTSGVVTKQLIAQGHEGRKVMLSRWCKPVRVVPDAEVAAKIKEFIGDHDVEIPENVVTPRQKVELEKLGVKIGAPEKGMNKNEQIADAIKLGLQVDNTVKEQRGSRWAGGEVLGMDKLPKENQMNPDELASEISQYHSDYITRMLENVPEDGTGTFFSAHNGTWYLYTVSKEDRSINLLKAFTASRENFDKFKEAIKDYGFNTETEDIYSNLQEVGRTNRSDSDLLDAFLRGGAGRDNRVHSGETEGEANNGNLGMDERTGEDTSSPRYFRSANGEVYGFTVDGKIYLDTKKMKPETPLHEYTHLWTEALRNSNPTEWENVKGLFDEVDGLKEEVQKLYPELKGDDLYEEMITTFSGREGAKKLEEVVRGLAKEDGKTVEESSKATGFIAKVKEALQKYWKGVADMLHIHFTSAEEVADKVLADWASGFNPNKAFDVNDRQGDYMKNNVEYIVKNTKLPFGKKYGEELSQEEVKSLFYGDNNYSKKYGKLFDRVYDVARKLGIKISFKIPPETHSAYGQAYLDNVYLNPILLTRGVHKVFPNKRYSLYVKEDTLPHAILHELIHSVTCYALERYERDKDSMPKELRVAAESLIDLYEATRKATLDYVNEYGRENEQEFIAELSNPNFCKLLKKTNVWTRVKDAIKQFFFPLISSEKNVLDKSWKETNSYKELSSLLDDFLEHSDKGIFEEEIGVQNGEIKGKEEAKEEAAPVMPKPVEPSNPIEAAAEDYKKEHPLSEDEILNTTAFDDLPEDQKQYCIDAALDYLNGEDTSAIAEAYYRNAYEKRANRPAETEKVAKADSETVKAGQAEVSSDPMEGIKNAAEGFEQEKAERERKQKEATQKVLNVIKASNEKAKTRKQLEAEKNAADNEFEAFMKDLRKKRSGQLNSGFIDQNLIEAAPKMFSLAAKCAYTRIKLGMYDAKEVVKDLRERFKDAFDGFDKRDVETFYSEIMNQKWRDGDKRMSLNEWAEHYKKVSPEYKEKLEGDSKDAEERKMSEKKFIDRVNIRLGFGQKINGIVELRKMAEECGLKDVKDTDLQELAETAIVKRARGIATSASTNDARKFELIKKLYENQPSLNQRDSERVMKQQYSTPAPYAFLADMYVKGGGKEVKSALEPSAGNGMLTIGLPMDVVHVNDIDAQRLANLRRQGFKNVTSQDGTQPFADKDVDVVVTNPPFGSAPKKVYDGYEIGSLEGQMAINALESMKNDGRAAIIIGGKTEYAKNGSLNPKDKAFLGYLYSHYNVEDVINVDGSLYAKQGTTYPTRIILINGRRLDENAFPPVKSKARAEAVKDYDELYKRINDDILRGERMDSSIGREEGSTRPELDRQGSADTHEEGVRMGEQRGSEQKPSNGTERLSSESSISGTNDVLDNRQRADREPDGELSGRNREPDRAGAESSPSEGTEARANSEGRVLGSGGNGRNDAQLHANEPTNTRSGGRPRGQLQRMDESVRGLSTEKVKYSPKSENPFTLDSVTPADQQEAVNKNLEKLGDADQFLVDELGYNDKDDLYSHLAAEQVDSVALALQQAKKGNAFIIGDMTGVGKGRQAASFVRYAIKNKQIPVYFTKTPELLSDVYRDLVDVGSPDLRPFILGDENRANVTDSEGNIVYKVPSKKEKQRVLDYIEKHGELPKEYDYVLTTYSQVGNAVYEYDENGNRKERKLPKGKSFGAAALSGQRRRDAIEKLMDNAYLILDESHTAGGNSGQGNYFQHIIQKAKNVTFFSATFAKRPDNMPIYALRTAMNQGGLKSSDLIDAVKRGGATLQEIMSQTLTQCGQMIRRERDMTGVTIDWRAIDEPEKVKEQREQYDSIIGLFNDIINFQKTYVSGYVEEQNEAMAAMQSTMGIKRGTEALGIKNVPFASKAFNTVQQVLLSLKAKSAAERAIDYLKQGMKPVIALNNTNESQTGNIALGEEMDAPDLGTSLRKGLEGTLRYTSKNAKDESSSGYIRLEDLGDDAVEAYHNLEKKIKETSTGLSLSPIDVIKNELEKAGYKVGELTGRSTEFVYNENGTVTKVKRTDTDKKKLAREFNDGQIDALILNKSAATGISLHASSKYKDQRKRVMIVAQQQLDVNDEVQMRGRIDRTGQVARGAYEYVVSLIPAEQRLLMMFKAKLKSLDANTTSSQKSKFNEMEVADITNKYGDKVVREYMAEHLDLYSRMADPFGWEKSFGDDLSSTPTQSLVVTKSGVGDGEAGADASKLLGRMALLKVAEQEKMLNEIGELYANEIQRLNEMGENDLEITELPLKAKTISKEVWKEGAEPGGDNAFADNTYIEKVNMAILKKPMKAEEVKKAQDGLTGGKSWDEYRDSKKAEVKNFFDLKIADETQRYEERAVKIATKAKEKYQKDAKKGQKDSGMSDEQIEKNAGFQYENIYKQEKDKLNDVVKNLKAKAEMFNRVLDTFNTEDAYVLPVDMNKPDELSGFGNSYGRLIDIKITDNFSPNASTVSFATLDGRRKITFPIAGKVGSGENRADVIGAIVRMTRQASGTGDKHLRVLSMDVANWDKLVSNESRKDGYIVTGNLMQALIDSKNQGVGGQLVKYTTDTGEVKTGILMPDRFKPTDVANEYPISSVADKFELPSHKGGIEQAVSSDGEVKVILGFDHGDTYYQIQVPKSKAKGGKYFLDKDLLSMVRGHNFESRGNRMMANIDENQLRPVLARLSNLGVKVREERKSSDDGTHFREDRGVQYSKTDAKDVKNSRIIPEDVDKTVSSQIEKRFDTEVERLYGKNLSLEEKQEIDKIANSYNLRSLNDEYRINDDDSKENVMGLSSAFDFWDKRIKEFEKKYGITRNTDISRLLEETREAVTNNLSGRNSGRTWEQTFGRGEGAHSGDRTGRAGIEARTPRIDEIYRYRRDTLFKESVLRAYSYHQERARVLSEQYGYKPDEWIKPDAIEKIFTDYNSDKSLQEIFDRIKDQVNKLDVYFGEVYGDMEGGDGFYRHSMNDIRINFDGLVAAGRTKQDLASTILHEMLHPVTSDIIAMYQKGHTDKLTKSQIEAAKDVVDIYGQLKSLYKKNGWKEPYALTNPREMITELANVSWRNALQKIEDGKSIWRRIVDSVRKFFGLTPTRPGLSDLNKALDNVLGNFGKEQFDFATKHANALFGKQSKLSDSPVSSHIAQLSEKVGAKVNMVNSAEEVTNKRAKEAIEEGKHITGWYDEKTGEVHLYMPNIHDRYTAEKTIWHEVVGHKGMRELFGEDRFNRFLRDVWYDLDKPENADLKKLVMEEMKYNPFNVYNAIEEGIARLAEEGRGEAGFWRNLKNKVSDFLHEIGYRMAPNTKDVKYLLWLSKNLQKNPNDPYWKMRAEAVKYRLDHEDVPDVIAKDGMFQSNDGKARDLGDLPKAEYQEATDGEIHFRTTPSAGTALDRYHRSLDAHGYMFTESYMDNMLSLKNLMTAIAPGKKIEDIASSENPYMLQNTMQGAMSDASKMFEIRQMKPLTDAMSKLLGAFEGKDIDEKTLNFNLYMIRKHGLERNRVFFVRDHIRTLDSTDARAMQKEWDIKKHELGDKLRNGDIDLREYYDQMDEWIRNNVDSDFKADEHDYSGFHGMYGIENSKDPYNDADVIADVMDREAKMEDLKKGSVKDFWSKVNAATSFGLYTDYKGGSQNRETYTKTSQMFDWYVPLRKFDETTAEDIYGYINESGDPSDYIGSVLMSAKGRKSLSETNILAQIGAMGNAAIYRAGNNAIKQAFMRFARNHDSQGLITESKVWLVKDGTNADGSDRWMEAYPQIPKDAAPKTVSNIVSKFEADMKAKEATGDARVLKNKADIGFRFERAKDKSQHAVDVMVNGQTHRFYINGNPRAAQALNGLLKNWNGNDIKYIGAAMRANAKVTRFFAQACTSLNPEFTLRNMVKDYELSTLNLLAKEGAKYTGIFEKYYFGLVPFNGMKSISLSDIKGSNGVGLFAKYRKGTLDMNNKVERYFKEFMENGGETGFVQMLGMKDWTKKYKAEIKSKTSSRSRVAKIVKYGVFGNIEGINEVAENMARFATYCASRDCGRSAVRSAYDAKEVTGNFNRQGSGSAIGSFKNGEMSGFKEFRKDLYGFTSCWLRNFSMFFNAGIQSTNLLLKNAKNNPVGTGLYIATGPMMLAALMPLVNQTLMAMLDDDEKDRNGVKDPYAELPDYVRRNNLCIYTGKGEFATIPLAIETRAFYGLGDLAADVAQNPSDKETGEIAQQALGQIAQLVPVMDYMGTKDFGENPVEASVQAFAPSSIEPWIEWKRNKDWKGQQIERRGEFYKNDPAWERANSGTNSSLIELNQFANAQTNDVAKGNEEMLGKEALDAITNPSMLEHYGAGIAKGAGTFSGKIAGVIKKGLITHEEIETKDIPFVRSFFYTPSETSSMQRTKSKFYNYADELSKDMDNVSKLKSKNVDPMKAFQNATDYYNFYNSPKAQQIQILERANKQIKAIQKMRNKQTDTEVIRMADQQIGLIMQGAVEQLDKLN
mgnify:CR=1 FL=1